MTPSEQLDATFGALADPTRRAILARLALGETSVTELAAPFRISLPAVTKHLKVLQQAGLITRGRQAQWRPCRIEPRALRTAADWIDPYRRISNTRSSAMTDTAKHVLITRTIAAPRELVFAAFTDARRLAQWWGPEGFTTPDATADPRPGGSMRLDMHGPDGTVYRGGGTYHEIVPPERLVFSTTILAEDGTTALAEIRNTLTLTERDGKTELTLGIVIVHVDPAVAHHMAGMEEGWTSSLVCLAEYLER